MKRNVVIITKHEDESSVFEHFVIPDDFEIPSNWKKTSSGFLPSPVTYESYLEGKRQNEAAGFIVIPEKRDNV